MIKATNVHLISRSTSKIPVPRKREDWTLIAEPLSGFFS